MDVEFGCQILDVLSVPALKHLTYHFEPLNSIWDGPLRPSHNAQQQLVQCLDRLLGDQVTPLEELDLWLCLFIKPVILDILCLTPGLKRLSIGGDMPSLRPRVWLNHSEASENTVSNQIDDDFLDYFSLKEVEDESNGVKDSEAEVCDKRDQQAICPSLEFL
ncbi:hypothetical protein NP233_g1097 [Leucocoprinus birnbaumii]|uniref:Uncharacterized protein n=1 Tax=Leucocoprinus birnbaumii TaxID=56174 RepID=A0AAD5W5Z0_9AGAR|nr:hypothetical protein NP233_g1097 [Leucocoprinus birnbaumii]